MKQIRSTAVRAAFIVALTIIMMRPSLAITAELARKCDALVARAFPLRQIGNPASGSSKGDTKAQVNYFKKCVANGGTMDDVDQKPAAAGSPEKR